MSDYGFKFKIGDVVRPAICLQVDRQQGLGWLTDYAEVRYVVLEQRIQICHGGEQRYYEAGGFTSNGRSTSTRELFTEIEIEASEPFPPVPDLLGALRTAKERAVGDQNFGMAEKINGLITEAKSATR